MQSSRTIWVIAAVGVFAAWTCSEPRNSPSGQDIPRSDRDDTSSLAPLDQHEVLHLVGGHSFVADPNISNGGVEQFDDSMTYRLSGPVEASGEYTISENRLCVRSPTKAVSRCFELFWSDRTIMRADPMRHPNETRQNLRPLRPADQSRLETPRPPTTDSDQ